MKQTRILVGIYHCVSWETKVVFVLFCFCKGHLDLEGLGV